MPKFKYSFKFLIFYNSQIVESQKNKFYFIQYYYELQIHIRHGFIVFVRDIGLINKLASKFGYWNNFP